MHGVCSLALALYVPEMPFFFRFAFNVVTIFFQKEACRKYPFLALI